jgi:hypothetical protein
MGFTLQRRHFAAVRLSGCGHCLGNSSDEGDVMRADWQAVAFSCAGRYQQGIPRGA